ncbi:MAG: YHYH protein [Bacteroidota bacterium]
MTKFKILASIFRSVTVLLLLIACSDDGNDTTTPGNTSPASFQVTVSDVTNSGASISWTEAIDADGDNVTYSVTINGSTVASALTTRTYEFSGLNANTLYSGSVTASDGNGGETQANFSFDTGQTGGGANQSPGSFTVTPSALTHNSANLTWTASIDPDGDAITYSVELGTTELVVSQTVTSYTLENLASGVAQSGKVIASDGNGGTSESSFTFTSYVIDISRYENMTGFQSATLVDCNYTEGGSGTCYSIQFSSNPVDDDGPFCPETTNDVGGFGSYDGTTNPGFQVMKASLFQSMEADGFDIISNVANPDGSFDINIETNVPAGGRQDGILMGSAACLQPTPDDNLTLTFEIPVIPTLIGTPDNIESVEFVGLALDGVPINGAPPSVVGNNGKIPSLDRCGGHHDPSGYYHWHFLAAHMDATLDSEGLLDVSGGISCTKKTQSATALVGYARDGYPIYSGQDVEGIDAVGLDACNGHSHATTDYLDGVYHYHASTNITNVPPCIVGKQSEKGFDKPM